MRHPRWISLGAMLGSLVWTGAAYADGGPKIDVGWYLPVGVPIGVALHDDGPPGFVLGAEVSLAHMNRDLLWAGLYADAVRDFAADEYRISLGPELGSEWYGIDAGYVFATGDGGQRHGFAVRPILTGALAAVYTRYEHIFGDRAENLLEIGLLFKFPIPVSTRFRPHWPEPERMP